MENTPNGPMSIKNGKNSDSKTEVMVTSLLKVFKTHTLPNKVTSLFGDLTLKTEVNFSNLTDPTHQQQVRDSILEVIMLNNLTILGINNPITMDYHQLEIRLVLDKETNIWEVLINKIILSV